jgi:hypothetical protein
MDAFVTGRGNDTRRRGDKKDGSFWWRFAGPVEYGRTICGSVEGHGRTVSGSCGVADERWGI